MDQASGIRFEGHHPYERPDLWQVYLDGAEGVYRNWGFEDTLQRRVLAAGKDVPLFFLAFNQDHEAVAGVRNHGPLEGAHEAFLMHEMAQSTEIDLIRDTIDAEVRYGAIEIKGAWSKGGAVLGVQLVLPITRCFVHAMNWLGAEYAVAAVSDRLLPVGPLTGGTVIGTTSVPFPDERYRTMRSSTGVFRVTRPVHRRISKHFVSRVNNLLAGPPWSASEPSTNVRRRCNRDVPSYST